MEELLNFKQDNNGTPLNNSLDTKTTNGSLRDLNGSPVPGPSHTAESHFSPIPGPSHRRDDSYYSDVRSPNHNKNNTPESRDSSCNAISMENCSDSDDFTPIGSQRSLIVQDGAGDSDEANTLTYSFKNIGEKSLF